MNTITNLISEEAAKTFLESYIDLGGNDSDIDDLKQIAIVLNAKKDEAENPLPYLVKGVFVETVKYQDSKGNEKQRHYFWVTRHFEGVPRAFLVLIFGFSSMNTQLLKEKAAAKDVFKIKYQGLDVHEGTSYHSAYIEPVK